jgi:hypothetical protein
MFQMSTFVWVLLNPIGLFSLAISHNHNLNICIKIEVPYNQKKNSSDDYSLSDIYRTGPAWQPAAGVRW